MWIFVLKWWRQRAHTNNPHTHYFAGELELKKLAFRDLSSLIYPDNHSVSNKILIRNIEIKLNSYWS